MHECARVHACDYIWVREYSCKCANVQVYMHMIVSNLDCECVRMWTLASVSMCECVQKSMSASQCECVWERVSACERVWVQASVRACVRVWVIVRVYVRRWVYARRCVCVHWRVRVPMCPQKRVCAFGCMYARVCVHALWSAGNPHSYRKQKSRKNPISKLYKVEINKVSNCIKRWKLIHKALTLRIDRQGKFHLMVSELWGRPVNSVIKTKLKTVQKVKNILSCNFKFSQTFGADI